MDFQAEVSPEEQIMGMLRLVRIDPRCPVDFLKFGIQVLPPGKAFFST